MRQPGWSDLDAAVRVLLSRPQAEWEKTAATLIHEAHVSDVIRKRLHQVPKGRGAGSLAGEAAQWRRFRPQPACGVTYCAALAVVIGALGQWREDPVRAGR